MAIVWKQPMLEDLVIDQHIIDELSAIEETGYLAAMHYRDQFVIHNLVEYIDNL